MNTNESIRLLESDEQRRVLDTVNQVRKCGLEGIVALPQLVVCGDQSAGKSSVLEAVTEIPFPRNDELCTRFATEITMRRSETHSLTIKLIPDEKRPSSEQDSLRAFSESITNFDELPDIMDKAMKVMGIGDLNLQSKAFAKDVLSVEIEGPKRPQLTLVDIPGIVQSETRGVTQSDVKLVAEITDHYIAQPRTICLAVVSATNDYANQPILSKVRGVDPQGERTLGIITKPDRLPPGSGSEQAYIKLARNEDVFFRLGWHVIKNRSFAERAFTFRERNISETTYFDTSNFKVLPRNTRGIDELRSRLSTLLFEHIKQELPKLHADLKSALQSTQSQLSSLGQNRSTSGQCKEYLSQLSLEFRDVCAAAVRGHYEGPFFRYASQEEFTSQSPAAVRRLRAMVQKLNATYTETMRQFGHKYHIELPGTPAGEGERENESAKASGLLNLSVEKLSHTDAIGWVKKAILRNRGRELQGNFNPLLISELFWEQSRKWEDIAADHVENVASLCSKFLQSLLQEMCPRDVYSRLWSSHFEDALRERQKAASQELGSLLEDAGGYPINYNHYYTDVLQKRRRERDQKTLAKSLTEGVVQKDSEDDHSDSNSPKIDKIRVLESFIPLQQDMEIHSCEEALDGMLAIYKVSPLIFLGSIRNNFSLTKKVGVAEDLHCQRHHPSH